MLRAQSLPVEGHKGHLHISSTVALAFQVRLVRSGAALIKNMMNMALWLLSSGGINSWAFKGPHENFPQPTGASLSNVAPSSFVTPCTGIP